MAVGLVGAGVNAGVYVVLTLWGWHYAAALVVAWAVSVLVGYGLNRTFTFRSEAKVSRSLPRVALIYLVQQGIAVGLIGLLVDGLGLDSILAYFLTVPFVVAFSFVAMKQWGFG